MRMLRALRGVSVGARPARASLTLTRSEEAALRRPPAMALRDSQRQPRLGTLHTSAQSYRRAFQVGRAMLVAALGLLAFSASAQALPDGLTLRPSAAENPVGTTHTLTATVTDAGTPVEGVLVGFSGNLNLDFFVGRCQESIFGNRFVVSDKNGKANCTFGGVVAGTETITAFADTNKDGALDNGEPSDTATKTWRSAPATKITLAPKGDVNIVGTQVCVGAQATNDTGPAGLQTVIFTVTGANPHSEALPTDT